MCVFPLTKTKIKKLNTGGISVAVWKGIGLFCGQVQQERIIQHFKPNQAQSFVEPQQTISKK